MALYLILFLLFCDVRSSSGGAAIYESCQQVYNQTCTPVNGVYNITTNTPSGITEIYCVVEDPLLDTECPGVGWTPVFHDQGSAPDENSNVFKYDAPLWTGNVGLNVDGGKTFNTVATDTLLPTFWSTGFIEVCLKNYGSNTVLVIPHVGRTLRAIFATEQQTTTNVNVSEWKQLTPDFGNANFPDANSIQGFNIQVPPARAVRLGILTESGTYHVIGLAAQYTLFGIHQSATGLAWHNSPVTVKNAVSVYVR